MVSWRRVVGALDSGDETVQSLYVQAGANRVVRVQGQFEVMVRHLFDRMLNNDAFGEDAALRVTQLAYAIGLPGVLVALFLLPAYHHPPPLALDRSDWSQACDHLFYVTYSLVILGTATVFQWELLFPDLLDMYVLSSLPIRAGRMLLGRVAALAIFLGIVQLETSLPGTLFLPGVADLKVGFARHFAAHLAAVTLAGVFAAVSLVALQGLLVCLPGKRLGVRVSGAVKAVTVVVLLTVLFLFPLVAHSLENLLRGGGAAARWFPPFWFLGVYECVLRGGPAGAMFAAMAWRGIWMTAACAAVGAVVYPVAYGLRVRRLVEGAGAVRGRGSAVGSAVRRVLHGTVVRTPRARAIFHFSAQTMWRMPRIHLYLSMYAGVGLALVMSGLLVFRMDAGRLRVGVAEFGMRSAVPVLAFWTVAGLRTAMAAPLGRLGSWVFRVIDGTADEVELRGGTMLVALVAGLVTLGAVALSGALGWRVMAGQAVAAVGLSVVLTDLMFLPVRAVPFTMVRVTTTVELPMILVRYFVAFPAFVLAVVAWEPWMERDWEHLLATAVGFCVVHAALRAARRWVMGREAPREELLFVGLGLRED